MEFTVQRLAALAGVSGRTLRYYDQIGLLKPARLSDSGYRLYGAEEVDLLQQILFYRELGMPLETIRETLHAPGFERLDALREHNRRLLAKRGQLDVLIQTVQRTIDAAERGTTMNEAQKFEGFKQELIDQNERQYGEEVRQKYGDETVDASNRKLMGLSQEDYRAMEETGKRILALLDEAFTQGDPAGEQAMEMAALHREWLGYSWTTYSPEAHLGLAQMYVEDERFAAYYDRGTPGKAVFLRDAIQAYLDRGEAAE